MKGWGMAVPWLVLATLAAVGAYVRLAPSDPSVWHIDPSVALPAGGLPVTRPGAAPQIVTTQNTAVVRVEMPGSAPEVLARLDAIALATPRTTRLAGSPEQGRITWITRSAFWGFPDYTTAQAATPQQGSAEVILFARSRFGKSDLGVNAARLRDWLSRL